MELVDLRSKYKYELKRYSRKKSISEIVIHHSWCKSLEKTMSTLINKCCGTHYCIDRDGVVYNVCSEKYRVSHCVDHNNQSIGIDIVRGSGQDILDVQYEALNELLLDIVDRYSFKCPVLHENVIFYHRDLRPTECPGIINDQKIIY